MVRRSSAVSDWAGVEGCRESLWPQREAASGADWERCAIAGRIAWKLISRKKAQNLEDKRIIICSPLFSDTLDHRSEPGSREKWHRSDALSGGGGCGGLGKAAGRSRDVASYF